MFEVNLHNSIKWVEMSPDQIWDEVDDFVSNVIANKKVRTEWEFCSIRYTRSDDAIDLVGDLSDTDDEFESLSSMPERYYIFISDDALILHSNFTLMRTKINRDGLMKILRSLESHGFF